jgi:hypothetical protein
MSSCGPPSGGLKGQDPVSGSWSTILPPGRASVGLHLLDAAPERLIAGVDEAERVRLELAGEQTRTGRRFRGPPRSLRVPTPSELRRPRLGRMAKPGSGISDTWTKTPWTSGHTLGEDSNSATRRWGAAGKKGSIMCDLGGVFGIAVGVVVFAGAGSFASADAFLDGFAPAIAVVAALSLGAIVAIALPGRRQAAESVPVGPVPATEAEGGS